MRSLLFPKIIPFCLALLIACSGPTPVPTIDPTPTPKSTALHLPLAEGITLPRDEGIHLAPVEWWYFNGHLEDGDGNQYSYHFVNFLTVTPEGLTPQLLQLGWADHGQGLSLTDEKPALATSLKKTKGAFAFQLGTWAMAGDGSDYRIAFDTGGYALQLTAASRKPAALHQGSGLVDLGRAGQTYYYSRTRLEVSGTLIHAGNTKKVSGLAWMDHQWGDFSVMPVGWDWTSVQLDDGAELMVSMVWDANDKHPINGYGTYIPASSPAGHLTAADIQWSANGSWSSPATGAKYPLGWELKVESLSLDLNLTPVIEDSEFGDSLYAPAAYWEGAVTVSGTRDGEPVNGRGFVELVGYAQGPTN
jgi:predicted secreted hydrolase